MKKLLLVLAVVALASFLFVGCFAVPEEPDPVPVISAEVYGLSWSDFKACCYIKNTGDVVVDYELTFVVDLYGHVDLMSVVEGEGLEAGDVAKECVDIYCPVCDETFVDKVLSVSVTYEL